MFGSDLRTDPRLDGLILRLSGAADYDAAKPLQGAVAQAIERAPRHIVLDVASLEFLNSGAIGKLVELRKSVLASGGRIVVAAPSKYVTECFRLSRLDHAFEMAPSVEEAIDRLRS